VRELIASIALRSLFSAARNTAHSFANALRKAHCFRVNPRPENVWRVTPEKLA
jgi:hypothetical protein